MSRAKMERSIFFKTAVTLFLLIGCARVRIESKEPIKLDVTMRLDVYQHVSEDARNIENMISAPKEEKAQVTIQKNSMRFDIDEAYAQEVGDFPAPVKEAIERRKERRQDLALWELKGVIGENRNGFVEIRNPSLADQDVAVLVQDENSDRQEIYQYVAKKNRASVEETAKIFAKQIQGDAPSGTPIEILDSSGIAKWALK